MAANDESRRKGHDSIDSEEVQKRKRGIVQSRFHLLADQLNTASSHDRDDEELVQAVDDAIVELLALRDLIESDD